MSPKQHGFANISELSVISSHCSEPDDTHPDNQTGLTKTCFTEFMLYDTKFDQTGLYTCHYTDSDKNSEFLNDSRYVFVNG